MLFKVWNGWFVGDSVAYYWNGDSLEARPPPDSARLLTVRGESAEDVWAVGGLSTPVFLHWHDGAWEEIDIEPRCVSQPLNGVWTDAGERVWLAGHFGTAAAYDPETTQYECEEPPMTSEHFHSVWKHGDEVLWSGGNLFSSGDNYGTIGRYGDAVRPITDVPACD